MKFSTETILPFYFYIQTKRSLGRNRSTGWWRVVGERKYGFTVVIVMVEPVRKSDEKSEIGTEEAWAVFTEMSDVRYSADETPNSEQTL
jgi:hypothetical protein